MTVAPLHGYNSQSPFCNYLGPTILVAINSVHITIMNCKHFDVLSMHMCVVMPESTILDKTKINVGRL
jgi:hypothetical protein